MVRITAHQSKEERMAAACRMKEDMKVGGQMLVDDMEDNFSKEFAAWPVRLYVIEDGKLAFISELTCDDKLDAVSLQDWLQRNTPVLGILESLVYTCDDSDPFNQLPCVLMASATSTGMCGACRGIFCICNCVLCCFPMILCRCVVGRLRNWRQQ